MRVLVPEGPRLIAIPAAEQQVAWVKWVSSPLLCYYREVEYMPWVGVQVLVPRTAQEMPESCDLP